MMLLTMPATLVPCLNVKIRKRFLKFKKKKDELAFILFIYIFITYPLSSVDEQLVQKLPPKLARPSNSTFLRSIPLKKERKKKDIKTIFLKSLHWTNYSCTHVSTTYMFTPEPALVGKL